jgi:DNA-binding SARP family transcriptional activator
MRRLARTVSRLIWPGLLVIGLPIGLLHMPGHPTPPRHWPSGAQWAAFLEQPASRDTAVADVAALGWVGWAILVYAILTDVGRWAARICRRLPRMRLPGPLQSMSAAILGAVAVSSAGTAASAAPPAVHVGLTQPTTADHPGPYRAAPVAPTRFRPAGASSPLTTHRSATPRVRVLVRAGNQHYTYTVHRGDTLWHIAAQWLGNPTRWPEIYHLNQSRYDQHGRMRHGDHIETDWVLTLPDDATPPPGAQPAAPTPRDPDDQQKPGTQTGPGAGLSAAPSRSTPAAPPTTATAPNPGASTVTSSDDPDGVVGTPPGTTPSAAPRSAAPTQAPRNDPAPTGNPQRRAHHPPGLTLPGGSWLDLGLATSIVAAVTLVWAHRRRRYTRRPPSAELRLHDPQTAAMPPVVNQIRRRLRHTAQHTPDPDGQYDLHDAGPHDNPGEHGYAPDIDDGDLNAGLDLLDQQRNAPDTADDDRDDQADDGDTDDDHVDDPAPPAPASDRDRDSGSGRPRPAVPSLAHPLSAVWPPAGLGLTGAGAQAAARAFLTAALAAGGPDDPDERSWVVMPSATAATLLGTDAVTLPQTPRLTVTAGLAEALDLLEAQTLHRSRLVDTHEVDTVADLRAADPTEEPLPPMLLLADATTRHQRTRIAALLAQGQRLDIHGVLLGAWPDGDTVVVAADGTTSRADTDETRHSGHPADLGRLAVLTPAETIDLLTTLAESHTGAPQAPAPVEPATTIPNPSAAEPAPHDPGARSQDRHNTTDSADHSATGPDTASWLAPQPIQADAPDAGTATPAHTNDGGAGHPADTPTTTEPVPAPSAIEPGGVDDGDPTGDAPRTVGQAGTPSQSAPGHRPAPDEVADADGDDTAGDAADDPTGPGRVKVTVLGPAGILDVPPGPTPRKKSVEVLVYLAVHDGQASAEAILDDLMPDVPASKAPGRLYTYISDLRTVLRRTGGPGTYLTHPNQRYALNHDIVEVDLWRMRDAIRDAEHGTDPTQRIAAWRRAVDTYGGQLAEGADYEWIEPYREAVRQQALDVYLALADALADNPAEQVAVLDAAIRHNPYVEELYAQAMRARAALGHLDAIRTLRRALTRALSEIDAEPADETITLAEHLIAGLRPPSRRPDLRPAPRPATSTSDGAAT